MSQSLYTAMGGITAATTEVQVVANNVANINTTAFKSSSVNFSDVFSTTLSSGSVATGNSGGTNPIQVGVGTQVSSISKDFNSGSWVATGSDTDLMVQGNGFFTAKSTDGQTYFTRAGDFSFDESGNLVTSKGFKVLGTSTILSSTSSSDTVQVPKSIVAQVQGNVGIGTQLCTNLNNIGNDFTTGAFSISDTGTIADTISAGTFTVTSAGGVPGAHLITLTAADVAGPLDAMAARIQTQIGTPAATGITVSSANGQISFAIDGTKSTGLTYTAGTSNFVATAGLPAVPAGGIYTSTMAATNATYNINLSTADVTGTIGGLVTDIQSQIDAQAGGPGLAGITVGSSNGQITFTINGKNAAALTFATPLNGATNFVAQADLKNSTLANDIYASKILDYTANISQLTSAAQAVSVNSETIGADGSIQATYSNGDTLSVQLGPDKSTYQFLYTTATGVSITGNSCTVDPNLVKPANFVVQVAGITNTNGLLAVGSNLFKAGPNSGNVVYSVGGQMGLGKLASGGLEASNVDLSQELSNMILAQRAIQANSRVFTTTSNIMDVINQMGR